MLAEDSITPIVNPFWLAESGVITTDPRVDLMRKSRFVVCPILAAPAGGEQRASRGAAQPARSYGDDFLCRSKRYYGVSEVRELRYCVGKHTQGGGGFDADNMILQESLR
jgi:hypothetical protein